MVLLTFVLGFPKLDKVANRGLDKKEETATKMPSVRIEPVILEMIQVEQVECSIKQT